MGIRIIAPTRSSTCSTNSRVRPRSSSPSSETKNEPTTVHNQTPLSHEFTEAKTVCNPNENNELPFDEEQVTQTSRTPEFTTEDVLRYDKLLMAELENDGEQTPKPIDEEIKEMEFRHGLLSSEAWLSGFLRPPRVQSKEDGKKKSSTANTESSAVCEFTPKQVHQYDEIYMAQLENDGAQTPEFENVDQEIEAMEFRSRVLGSDAWLGGFARPPCD